MDHLRDDDLRDRALVTEIQAGKRDALEKLVRHHQPWVLHIAHRMLWNRGDAEDATQEILFKAITHLGEFRQQSSFRTWLYRIAVNHLLDRCRTAKSFDQVALSLNEMPDGDLPDPNADGVERAILVEEAKIACTTGMLLCLKPRHRLVFILGEILGVNDEVGAEILDTTAVNFRQMLSRARGQLYGFLNRQCGLVNKSNQCRCARKTPGFIAKGWVRPEQLQFVSQKLVQVQRVAPDRMRELQDLERQHAQIFRDQPLLAPREHALELRRLLFETGIRDTMGLE
jgi:RNA polymerase sigma factor (sigma-70 family)